MQQKQLEQRMTPTSSHENKSEGLRRLREALAMELFDQVERLCDEYAIGQAEMLQVASTVFKEHLDQVEYRKAIQLGQLYRLDAIKLEGAIKLEFGRLLSEQRYEDAIRWSSDYSMSVNEVLSAVVKLFESRLDANDAGGAVEIAERYQVPRDMVTSAALAWFNRACLDRNFYWAAKIGRVYHIAPKRVLIVAMKAMLDAIRKNDWPKVFDLQELFEIISDACFAELREQDRIIMTDLIFQFGIKKACEDRRYLLMHTVVQRLRLLQMQAKVPELRKLTVRVYKELLSLHNTYLHNDQLDEAVQLCTEFNLLDRAMPAEGRNTMIQLVQKKHNTLLRQDDYSNAKRLRVTYDLVVNNLLPDSFQDLLDASKGMLLRCLHNGRLDLAQEIVRDYDIPKKLYVQEVVTACVEHLGKQNFEKAFEIRESFKIDPGIPEIQHAAREQFDRAYRDKLNEVAAEIGRQFRLDKGRTRKLAVRAWKRHMEALDLDAALSVARRHRLPRSLLHKTARRIYFTSKKSGETEIAERIRREYRFQFTLVEAVVEFIRSVFHPADAPEDDHQPKTAQPLERQVKP